MSGTTARRRVLKVPVDGVAEHRADLLAAEEPLEIRVDGEPLTVTMRTPGDDIDLAAGFLFTEGLLTRLDAVREIRMCDDNVAAVTLEPGQESMAARVAANRNFLTTSACGVCGKDSIEAIRVRSAFDVAADPVRVSPAVWPGCRTGSGRLSRCSAGPEGCTRPACSAPTARCSRCARTWAGTTRWTRWPAGRCATAGCPWPATCCWSAAGPRSSSRRRRS